jgi:hypothetical protein
MTEKLVTQDKDGKPDLQSLNDQLEKLWGAVRALKGDAGNTTFKNGLITPKSAKILGNLQVGPLTTQLGPAHIINNVEQVEYPTLDPYGAEKGYKASIVLEGTTDFVRSTSLGTFQPDPYISFIRDGSKLGSIVSSSDGLDVDYLVVSRGWENCLADSLHDIWPRNSTVNASDTYPYAGHWTITGTGGSMVHETSTVTIGDRTCKVVYGSAEARLTQNILTTNGFNAAHKGTYWGLGAWVYPSAVSNTRLFIYDGNSYQYSDYSSGSSAWEWISTNIQVDASSSTRVQYGVEVSSGNSIVTGHTVLFGKSTPSCWIPSRSLYGQIGFKYAGSITTGDDKDRFHFFRPTKILRVNLQAGTAPVSSAATFDLDHWDGSTWNALYQAGNRPQLAASSNVGGSNTDATTYRYLCLDAYSGSDKVDAECRVNIDAAGGTAAADVTCEIMGMQFIRPFDIFNLPNEVR